MMVDNHHVRFLGIAPGLHQVTLTPDRTIAAQAVVARGSHQGPNHGVLRNICQLCNIATARGHGPVANLRQLPAYATLMPASIMQRIFHAMQAKVIGASLEQSSLYRAGQYLLHSGQIA